MFYQWLVRALVSTETVDLALESFTKPYKVGNRYTPDNLDNMNVGQMVKLSMLRDGKEMFYTICGVLLGMNKQEIDMADAVEVVRFTGWVLHEIKRINRLFDSVKSKPTQQEIKAGINNLNFGIFGLIDWYACRMGIADHEEVMDVTWLRLYKCMDMDNRTNEYKRNLAKVYADEYRR